jgi:O-antigen ligase
MTLGLALFYRGGALTGSAVGALLGLLLFGALALLRPDLGLLFVPLTAPLYLIPASIAGIRTEPLRLPLHEVALLVVLGATAATWLVRKVTGDRRPTTADRRPAIAALVRAYGPQLLFLLAGFLGVLLAVERAPALREFRWLIAEPLLFYALARVHIAGRRPQVMTQNSELKSQNSKLATAFIVGGAVVGLLGLLQYAGLDLVPFLGEKQCFCDNIVADGGVRRVTSAYGHPNNLGLYLGRVWPLAAALAVAGLRTENREPRTRRANDMPGSWFLVVGSLLSLGGLVVSFSRGAWLGAVAALAILALGLTKAEGPGTKLGTSHSSFVACPEGERRVRRSSFKWIVGLGAALAVVAGLALSLRGDVTAGSTPVRLLLWREALAYIRLHPLGIGLDQFGYYHDPKNGLSLIDPSLLDTSEVYASHPHNLALDAWLRLGPLGLIAFAWLLARFLRAALRDITLPRRAPLAAGALAALGAALVHGLVDNFYFVPDLAIAFWLLLALVEISEEPRTENQEPL